jgi:hypothetical protein
MAIPRHQRAPRLSSTSNRRAVFSRGVAQYRTQIALERKNAIQLGTTEQGAPLHYLPDLLRTHTMIQAPTGAGKSFLARILFREIAKSGASIYVDDPKHDFLDALEEDCAALGLDDRVTIFDTSDPARTPLFNPLKKNGIAIEDQSAWLLSAIRSCFRQDSFDLTPQRPRWMANALIPVIEGEGTFDDVLAMLNFQEGAIRRVFVERTTNELVRKEWLAYEELSMTRRRDETYSAFAWLRKFCLSDTLRHIFTPSPNSFDFGRFLTCGGILLQSFPRFRPLDEDATQFLRSLSLYSLLAQAFHIPPDKRPPLVIILDEAEHALARDSGVIATILREGRGLNIHLILLFHEFAEVAAHNPGLLETVLNGCRTKFIGGHLTQSNLEILTSELFTTDWHPHIVRDEITALEVEPVETTRMSRSRSRSRSQERGCSFPYSKTDGTSESETTGTSIGESAAISFQHGTAHGRSRAHTIMDGVADSEAYGESHMSGTGYTSGVTDAHGTAISAAAGTGMTETWNPHNPAAMFPDAMTISMHEMAGMSESGMHAESHGESASDAHGSSYMHGTTRSHAEADTVAESEAVMRSQGESFSVSQQRSESATTGTSHAVSRGVTPSVSEGESVTESETIAPFHELRKRWRVASREFLTLQDFLATKLIKLKSLPTAHWTVQTPQGKVVFFRALFVKSLVGGKERLPTFRRKVFGKPCYQRDDLLPMSKGAQVKAITPELLLAPDAAPDDDDFFQ